MKLVNWRIALYASIVWTLCAQLLAQKDVSSESSIALEAESRTIADAVNAARKEDQTAVQSHLTARGNGALKDVPHSVLVARRAVEVCGWLRNENDYGRAIKVAQRALGVLDKMKENSDADRAERLYWEAVLHGEMLDQKVDAIALLREAERIKPDDERVTSLQLRLVAAVAEFGR